jgi:hypothetical protein
MGIGTAAGTWWNGWSAGSRSAAGSRRASGKLALHYLAIVKLAMTEKYLQLTLPDTR